MDAYRTTIDANKLEGVLDLPDEFKNQQVKVIVIHDVMPKKPKDHFEDAVQYSTALLNGIDGIVTRDVEGYSASEIKVYTPEEIVEFFNG